MNGVMACQMCGLVQQVDRLEEGMKARCARCQMRLAHRKTNSRSRTAAFALAALLLYIPANVFPILHLYYLGSYSENTIWEGCRSLVEHNNLGIAIVVFVASILFPLLKLLGLFYLVITVGSGQNQKFRTLAYRFICWIGPWAMLDVFLLSILVAVLKLEQMGSVLPGPGIVAFAAVVILTLFASASFDPRLIWDEVVERGESKKRSPSYA